MSDRQSRSRSHGAEAGGARGRASASCSRSQDRVDRALRDFRDKWPVDDTAYDFLAKAPEKVQKIVLESFQPRGQNSHHKDYSALLTKFVQSIIERQGGDKGKWKGGKGKGRWADVRDFRDRSRGRNRDGRNRKDSRSRGRRESREPRRSTRERGRRRSRQRSDDSRDKRPKNRSKDRKADARSYSVSASRRGSSDRASRAESDDSNLSGGEAESGSEGDLRKRAEEIREKEIVVAAENEKDKLAEAEEKERRIVYEEVMKLVDNAEKEMSDKLAEYEDLLRAEKNVKIENGKREVEAASKRRLSTLADELEEDRKREEKDVQAVFDATMKKLKDLKGEEKKDRLQKRRHQELVDAMVKKGEAQDRPEKEESKRRDSPSKSRRRRDGFGRDARNGERARRKDSCDEDSRDDIRRRDSDRRDRSHRRDRNSRGRRRSRSRASASCSRSQDPRVGGSTDLDRELRDFRHRWPVDDSAYDFLAKASETVVRIVLESFQPRGQSDHHKDYSALLTKFVQSIIGRKGGKGKGKGGSRGQNNSN